MNLRQRRAALIEQMRQLSELDEMTAEQAGQFDDLDRQVRELDVQIERAETQRARVGDLTATLEQPTTRAERTAPATLRNGRGDSEARALRAYLRSGDNGGLRHLMRQDESGASYITFDVPTQRETRAVVDSTMNITTGADGGYLVPTTLAGQIALRKNERMLAERIGCRRVPGAGTTVNYPYESADPEVFAATSEQNDAHSNTYERNTLPTALKAFTLAKKTRKLELTEELLEDEATALMDHIADRIGREIGKTHNTMLVAEAVANGTLLKSFAGTSAIAAGELEALVGNDNLSFYLEDAATVNWVMRSSTLWAIRAITGNQRLYAGMEQGLLGYNTHYSNAVAAMAANAKSALFGNWDYMGYREGRELRFIQDPYSVDGLVGLKYSFRAVYGILQPAAIGFGQHAAV